jgi:hypothetical protein
LCHAGAVRKIVFAGEAVRQFACVPRADRAFLKDGVRAHLAQADPRQASRDKFRLRRVAAYAEYELRLSRWHVFCRLRNDTIEVTLIGEKKGNILLIDGERFTL